MDGKEPLSRKAKRFFYALGLISVRAFSQYSQAIRAVPLRRFPLRCNRFPRGSLSPKMSTRFLYGLFGGESMIS